MEAIGTSQLCKDVDAQALAVAVFKDEKAGEGLLKTLDEATGGLISRVIQTEEFAAKPGETAYFLLSGKGLKAGRLLLIGCGERDAYQAAQISRMAGTASRFLRSKNAKSIAIAPRADGDVGKVAQTAMVGAIMGLFEPDKYRTKDKEERELEQIAVVIEGGDKKALKRGADRGRIIGEAANFTRDLANEPGGYLTPTILAARAQKVAKQFGLGIDVLDQRQMEKLGMGSLLGVSRGSDEPPKLIVMKYEPRKPGRKQKGLLALVGKGITFDSGGISLKPGENMELMKYDMTGAATVIGAMQAIEAGKEVGEKFWQLPLDSEYTNQIKSDIADIKNVGGKKAGTITAAAFLKEFADDTSWAHLDIAGTAWSDTAQPYRSKGPTGVALRTLVEFIEGSARQNGN